MCGIVGILRLNGQPASGDYLERMSDCMRHRGPDDAGVWLSDAVGMGVRRLSIIDREQGHQPLSNEDGTVWIVFNGEIYNFAELRRGLESKGHRFRTHSDTETIVHAYEEWGEECPQYLHGMFAFAIYDLKSETLFLARDRVGKKPLLYTEAKQQLLFASEFGALLAHPDVPRQPNLAALDLYLSAMCIPAPMTAYDGIHKLLPGHTLTVRKGEIRVQRYWSFNFAPKLAISEEDAAEELLFRLEEAVRVRLMGEVPVGAFLSGGIDSSSIVALMSRVGQQPVKTFAVGFEEAEYSELAYARIVADQYGTDHTEIIVKPDVTALLPQVVRHYGEPYGDWSALPTWHLSQAARRQVTVVLNGDGGDEVFAGYDRHLAMKLAELIPGPLLRLGSLASAIFPSDGSRGGSTLDSGWIKRWGRRGARLNRLLQVASLPRAQRYLRWTSAFSSAQKQQLYTSEFKAAIRRGGATDPAVDWLMETSDLDVVEACLLADTMCYLPNDLLVKVDIAGMANSLEARSPFLDHTLMEWSARLPVSFKLRGRTGKYILRKALTGIVPEAILRRPKMGFGLPMAQWFRAQLKPLLYDVVLSSDALGRGYFQPCKIRQLVEEHLRGEQDHSFRLWSLLMLELWHQEFIDEQES